MHRFYELVAEDPVLRPVYPAQDLGPAEDHLRLFLIQYWGGPQTYNELRGHPRLRMRHVRFVIGEAERDAWLRDMRISLDELTWTLRWTPSYGTTWSWRPTACSTGPAAPSGARPGSHAPLTVGPVRCG